MKTRFTPDKELRHLIDGILEERLRKSEVARLEERLEEDPQAMRYYLDLIENEALLGIALESMPESETVPVSSAKVWWWGIAAALALSGVILSLMFLQDEKLPLARVSESIGVQWVTGGEQLEGAVEIDSGLLEITYGLGTRVVLQGPAKFEVTGRNSARLHFGQLVAEVPPAAKNFTVEYPDGRVIDLGTEFGVTVPKEGEAEVCVFRGEIDVMPGSEDGGEKVRLFSDHAVRMAPEEATGLKSVPFVRSRFVRDLPSQELPWTVRHADGKAKTVRWDVSDLIWHEGDFVAVIKWMDGADALEIEAVRLFRDGKLVVEDRHAGTTGDIGLTRANVYRLAVAEYQPVEWSLEATLRETSGALDSEGVLIFQEDPRAGVVESDFHGAWEYRHDGRIYRRVFYPDGRCTLEIDGLASPHFEAARYEVSDGILHIHFEKFDWVEEHMLRRKDQLLFLNRPYRDALRM